MKEIRKVEAFSELHNLLIYYSEYRDQPVEEGFDFFKEVKTYCEILEIDFEEFKKEFELN
ncbi:hypothetical protein [Virgibacillus sp. JSM 102003]|uniref:hypothetical protein n=1 Tax=Virgibacillus sp. JSM 102003 TaxID=1562108 RepID=UPI0035BF2008